MASDQDELAGLLGTRKGKSKADPHLGKKKRVMARYVDKDGNEFGTPSVVQTVVFDAEAITPETLARMRATPFPRPKLVVDGDVALRRLEAVREQVDCMAYRFDPARAARITRAGQAVLAKTLQSLGTTWWPDTDNAKTQIGPTDV